MTNVQSLYRPYKPFLTNRMILMTPPVKAQDTGSDAQGEVRA
jgi:hypothetical protein